MRKPISIVLAGLLVVLPLQQVQAQVAQQEAVSVDQTAPPEDAAQLFRVPPLTENTARLWRTTSDRTLLSTPFADVLLAKQDPTIGWTGDRTTSMGARDVFRVKVLPVPRMGTAGKVVVTVLAIAVVLALGVVIVCAQDGRCDGGT